MNSSNFRAAGHILAPCRVDAGATYDDLLFVGCYQKGVNQAYLSTADGPFSAVPIQDCGTTAKITDATFSDDGDRLLIAVSACGFFELARPFFGQKWTKIWSVKAYSVKEITRGFIYSSNAESKVLYEDQETGLLAIQELPGAYRAVQDSGRVWITSITSDAIWSLDALSPDALDLTKHELPTHLKPRWEHSHFNDVCAWNGKIFVADRFGGRVLTINSLGDKKNWKSVPLGKFVEPVRWICLEDSAPLLITQGVRGGLFRFDQQSNSDEDRS